MEIGVVDEVLITDSVDRHYGFPRLVRVQNGDLLLFYRVGTTHAYDDSAIAMRRSCDNGASHQPSDQPSLQLSLQAYGSAM